MSRGFDASEYYWPTSDAAEIHSMSMEYFAYPYMDLFFNGEAEKYRYSHLVDSILFLPYGVSVDEFQHGIYENPEMSPAERNQLWRSIEKKYLPQKNYEDNTYLNNGGWWQTQGHIYQSPFYYIDYTLAQMCAFQFWFKAQKKRPEALNDYIRLCKAGGSKSFLELVDYANLKSPFDKGNFTEIISELGEYLEKVDEGGF
jgi:M3 family oligoendopeptidase